MEKLIKLNKKLNDLLLETDLKDLNVQQLVSLNQMVNETNNNIIILADLVIRGLPTKSNRKICEGCGASENKCKYCGE